MIKQFIVGVAISASFIVGINTAFAGEDQKTVVIKKTTPFLFVISAGEGRLKALKNGEYGLTMKLPDVNQVIMFSDRPKRILKVISAQNLKYLGSHGANNYDQNPPNAVLSTTSFRPVIVTLTKASTQGDQAYYQFKLMVPKQKVKTGQLKNLVLTIDEISLSGLQNILNGGPGPACGNTYEIPCKTDD